MTVASGALDRRRWSGALGIALAAHALPLSVAAWWLGPVPVTAPAEPAVLIDMAPLAAPARPVSEQPPGPHQVRAETPRPPVVERVEAPVAENPAVAIAAAPPPPPPRIEQRIVAPEATAPPARPAPPAPRAASGAPTWQGLVLGQLEKFKRYPADARARRQQGVSYIKFAMDRDGRVLSARLERSSGYATLDRETLALVRRAQPLPKPPPDVPGDTVELVVPVEFFIR